MINLTKFVISDTQYLKINPECIHDDECKFCANIDLDYIDEANKITIRFGYDHFPSFCSFISKFGRIQQLINNEAIFDDSSNDLGFEWNQFYQGLIKDTDVLEKYHFESNSHKQIRPYFNSWLYNDKDGNVIFEITPFYPWHGESKKSNPDFITYKQFMKNYKPILKTIIPKENLIQWIAQAKELGKIYFPEFEWK